MTDQTKILYLSYLFLLSVLLCIFSGCEKKSESTPINQELSSPQLNWPTLAAKIIDLAQLEESEGVLLVGMPGRFDPLIDELITLISHSSASYLGVISVTEIQPVSWSSDFTSECKGKNAVQLAGLFEKVDLGIMLPGATPNHLPYKVLQNLLTNGARRTIHFHWAGAYDLNGTLLEPRATVDSFYQHVIINTDYSAMTAAQTRFESEIRGHTIFVSTPAGTNIQFECGDRPVTKQDGDATAARARKALNLIDREIEIPSGAIRVAPVEETVEGVIAFPDAQWDGQDVKDLVVTIKAGKIVNVQAREGKEAVLSEMNKAGEAGKSFREFALGFNPLMPLQQGDQPWIPYYGYGAGIVRLSLGDNTELGGKVSGGYVRWNFFPDATVAVGTEIWVKDGKLIK